MSMVYDGLLAFFFFVLKLFFLADILCQAQETCVILPTCTSDISFWPFFVHLSAESGPWDDFPLAVVTSALRMPLQAFVSKEAKQKDTETGVEHVELPLAA